MENYRLKIKIGENEFEAEGPAYVVQEQFASFQKLITAVPPKQSPPEAAPPLPHLPLEKIIKVDGRVVSLTAKCDSVDEAALLILLGQKELRNNQEVTGGEMIDGLKQSGYMVARVDRTMDKLAGDGSLITIGVHRGRRYRLTNQGVSRALLIAKEVIETVP